VYHFALAVVLGEVDPHLVVLLRPPLTATCLEHLAHEPRRAALRIVRRRLQRERHDRRRGLRLALRRPLALRSARAASAQEERRENERLCYSHRSHLCAATGR